MKKYELLEHTADIGVIAYGTTKEEAFCSVAEAMFDLMCPLNSIQEKTSFDIEVDAEDLESLLVTWLNELLYVFEVKKLLFKEFKITLIGSNQLISHCFGEKFDPKKHELQREIKAATFNLLKIENHGDHWTIQVVFDL
ncbi:MAG TPA: archease [Dictyoglomaceae bacterium]|nr:archease [Dictyoglomaceae bacterium]HOL38878.1 archease [Dictyoglomaceae bacterium]HOP94934.1 archease [Dictyoglomaceae bacterium]HPP15705.1 archease [Dictyoglomaceae bacterium]HPU43544.1 archease [Dictyoglomaceae bacterium]